MKIAVNIARVIVGLLFIFSGLIKANDPLGLSYKMQEFFEIWGMEKFNSWTLTSSVLMNGFEIIAGFALLLGWRIRLFSWLLLLLILFFTFLTGYTYVTGNPKNCGCFGDCLPITAKTSFLKDVALTVLIGFIFWKHKYIKPLLPNLASALAMLLITILSFGIQWYTLNYLPVIDCLPYKINNNIPEKMRVPPGAIPDSFMIVFVYEKDGKQYEFTPSELPSDLETYKYIKRSDKVKKGNAEPAIHDFVLSGITDEDSTQVILSQPGAVLLFCQDFSTPVSKWKDDFVNLYTEAKKKNIPVYAITAQLSEAQKQFASTPFNDIPILKCDFITMRTAARANPCIFLLEKGTIIDKQSYRRMDKIKKRIEAMQALSNNQ